MTVRPNNPIASTLPHLLLQGQADPGPTVMQQRPLAGVAGRQQFAHLMAGQPGDVAHQHDPARPGRAAGAQSRSPASSGQGSGSSTQLPSARNRPGPTV